MLLCHCCDIVLLAKVIPLEILQTFVGVPVIPEPTLSSADAVQRTLDFAAKRLPRVVLGDSVMHGSRILAHLSSTLLMLLPSPKNLPGLQELRKSRIFFKFELSNICTLQVCASLFLAKALTKMLPRGRFILLSGSEKLSLLMRQSTSSRFALIIESLLCSLCNQLNSFLRSMNCK